MAKIYISLSICALYHSLTRLGRQLTPERPWMRPWNFVCYVLRHIGAETRSQVSGFTTRLFCSPCTMLCVLSWLAAVLAQSCRAASVVVAAS